MSELKPCPFCGGEVTARLTPQGYIWCDNCHTPFNAVDELFNTRPIEDKLTATIAERDAEIERLNERVEELSMRLEALTDQ